MPVHVRDATVDDAAALSQLWSEHVDHTGAEAVSDPPEAVVAKAVLRFSEGDEGRILVAEVDGSVVGCGFLRVGLVSPLHDGRVVHLSHVQVASGYGRQGVGTAIVDSALAWAERRGIGFFVTAVPAAHREANRFLARLGMAPVASLRGGPVATLRTRLPHAAPTAGARQNGRAGRSVGQVVAARRSQRRLRSREVSP